jgi:trimethylamine--corrinoid protein Co-methyltransferase
MTKLSLSGQPAIRLLSSDEIEMIHLSSLKILEEVGVMIQSDNALKLLAVAGADIDASKKIARIPQHLAKESLVKAPSTIAVQSRRKTRPTS